jgi:DNA-binding beta-propeller fold protein YncE
VVNGLRASALRAIAVTASLLVGLGPSVATRAESDDSKTPVFHNIGTVTEPAIAAIKAGVTSTNPTGKFASFDISWVDNERNVYYLADRSNNQIDVIDTTDGSFVKGIGKGMFSGVQLNPPKNNGPDGVVTDQHHNVWVGDGLGNAKLKEFDPNSGALIGSVNIGGDGRADELAFGNVGGGRILIGNPNESTFVFASLVNTARTSVIGTVVYDEKAHAGLPAPGHGFIATGLEQPVFLNGKFYLNVPATVQNPDGEIDVFDANKAEITAIFRITSTEANGSCAGTGLAVGPRGDLIVECAHSTLILDANGNVEATIKETGGGDEIWFNPGDGNVYIANAGGSQGLGVIDVVHNNRFLEPITPIPGGQGEHSIAVSSHNNRIFVPINDNPDNGAGGIAMFHKAGQRGQED